MNRLCFAYLSVAVLCVESHFYNGHRYHHNRFLDSTVDDIDAQTDFWDTFQKQMRSLFYERHLQFGSVNVTDDAYITTLPLQGFTKDDITVRMSQNILSVVAQHSTRYYSYTYLMPEDAQCNLTTAKHYEDGYLVVNTPRVKSSVEPTVAVVSNADTEDEVQYNSTPQYSTPDDDTRSFATIMPFESPEEEEEEAPRPNYGFRPFNPDAEILEVPELSRVKSNKFRRPELIGFTTTAPDLIESQDANQMDNDVLVNVLVV